MDDELLSLMLKNYSVQDKCYFLSLPKKKTKGLFWSSSVTGRAYEIKSAVIIHSLELIQTRGKQFA